MKLSKNKKGLWGLLITFAIMFAVAFIVFSLSTKWQMLGNSAFNLTQFGLAGGDTPNTFLFWPEKLSIAIENNNCAPNPSATTNPDKQFTCKQGTVNFETDISNGGVTQRRFYGGIIVCEIKCNRRGTSCKPVDDTCLKNIIETISGTCTVKNGETKTCDSGSYTFKNAGTYVIYPVAICFLDNTYGCSQAGLTEAPKEINPDAYLYVTVS